MYTISGWFWSFTVIVPFCSRIYNRALVRALEENKSEGRAIYYPGVASIICATKRNSFFSLTASPIFGHENVIGPTGNSSKVSAGLTDSGFLGDARLRDVSDTVTAAKRFDVCEPRPRQIN